VASLNLGLLTHFAILHCHFPVGQNLFGQTRRQDVLVLLQEPTTIISLVPYPETMIFVLVGKGFHFVC